MANDFEQAALDFIDDLKALEGEYNAAARPHSTELEAVKEECRKRIEDANRKFWNAAREQNAKYSLLVDDAAKRRMEQAEHPQDVAEAARSVSATMGGPCHDNFFINIDSARAHFHACADRREQQEQWERETQARGLKIIWL